MTEEQQNHRDLVDHGSDDEPLIKMPVPEPVGDEDVPGLRDETEDEEDSDDEKNEPVKSSRPSPTPPPAQSQQKPPLVNPFEGASVQTFKAIMKHLLQHPEMVPNTFTYLREELAKMSTQPDVPLDTLVETLRTTKPELVLQVVQRVFLGGDQLSRLRAACALSAASWNDDEKEALLGVQPVLEDFHMVLSWHVRIIRDARIRRPTIPFVFVNIHSSKLPPSIVTC